jgi:trk system potassium uptake protein TrkH
MIGVLQILSQALGGLAFALLVPAAIAATSEEGIAENFLVTAGLIGFLSGAIYFGLQGRRRVVGRADRFVLVVALWAVVPIVASLPIMLSTGVSYVAALFEAASGFTTTGATVFDAIGDVGPAVVFWRAELQWLGGLATLLTFVLVLAPAELGGLSARGLALVGGFGDRGPGRVGDVMRTVTTVYATVTGACVVLLFVGGLPTFDAICLAFATVSTGGFMPIDGTVSSYGSRMADVVVPVFMMIGATGITWQRMVLDRRWTLFAEHRETYWVMAVAFAAGLLYATRFVGSEGIVPALGEGLFSAISIVSTTGFETRPAGLAALPDPLVLILALAGAASLSTAGGLKFYRIGAMVVQASHELKRVIFPHSVRSTRFGSQPYDLGRMKAVWANLGLSLVVIMTAALILALALPSFDAAFIATISAFSNIGPLYSPEWPIGAAWPRYGAFDDWAKLVMVATMILGRLEVIVFFAAINPTHWRS